MSEDKVAKDLPLKKSSLKIPEFVRTQAVDSPISKSELAGFKILENSEKPSEDIPKEKGTPDSAERYLRVRKRLEGLRKAVETKIKAEEQERIPIRSTATTQVLSDEIVVLTRTLKFKNSPNTVTIKYFTGGQDEGKVVIEQQNRHGESVANSQAVIKKGGHSTIATTMKTPERYDKAYASTEPNDFKIGFEPITDQLINGVTGTTNLYLKPSKPT